MKKLGVLLVFSLALVLCFSFNLSFVSAGKYYVTGWASAYCAYNGNPCQAGEYTGSDLYTCSVSPCNCNANYDHGCSYYACGGYSWPTVCSCRIWCCSPSWGDCSAPCGPGTQSDGCGHSRGCNNGPCCSPVNGGYTDWGACSATCGGGTQTRTCTNPAPSCGGASCVSQGLGPASQACNTQSCCTPSKTCADYSGQCGIGFSDGCSSVLTCGCSVDYHCSVSSGQGSCLPDATVNKPYWSNLQINGILTSAEVGDTVLMKVPGTNLGTINYTVYKDIFFWSDQKMAQQSSLGYSSWVAGKKADGTLDIGNFYFLATFLTFTNTSDTLNVKVANSTSDSMPVARIDYPNATDFRFSSGSSVALNQSSYDVDDMLNLTWNFGDGNSSQPTVNYAFVTNLYAANTFHSYLIGGKWYAINLTAQEATRNQSASDTRNIYILKEGINVVPVISLPSNGGSYADGNVPFNASQSYVTNCSSGVCPLGKTCFQVGNLYCFYLHAPGTKITSGYDINVNWTISGQNSISGNWSSQYSTVVDFTRIYIQPGTYTAKLKLRYLSGSVVEEVESLPVSFSAGAGWICNYNAATAFWSKTGQPLVDATNNCTLYNSTYYPSCCPSNCLPCESNGKCNCTAVITICNDYKTQASCNNAPSGIAKTTLGSSGTYCGRTWTNNTDDCDYSVTCGCVWNASSSSCNIARATYTKMASTCTINEGYCNVISTAQNNCNSSLNNIISTTTVTWHGFGSSSNCEGGGTNSFPCPSVAKLSFASDVSVIIAVILIIFTYVYLLRRKTKRKSKRK